MDFTAKVAVDTEPLELGVESNSQNDPLNNQIESLIQDELNSNNFERSINIAFSHLSHMINLNNPDLGLLNLNSTANNNSANGMVSAETNSNNNISDSDIGLLVETEKNDIFPEFLTTSFLSEMDKESAEMAGSANDQSPVQLTASSTVGVVANPSKLVNRFNYKCRYCSQLGTTEGDANSVFSTKFKAHIIEHMQTRHKICLMECPEATCRKRFKDEWKLKRHLLSNREHGQLAEFKNLYDVMRQHVEVTPQKSGFPCPFCQVNQSQVKGNPMEVNNLSGDKNPEDFVYFSTYDFFKAHMQTVHPTFNTESNYFMCKQCGQVFQNRYKLSCHLFNVHSGKRKSRTKKSITKPTQSVNVESFTTASYANSTQLNNDKNLLNTTDNQHMNHNLDLNDMINGAKSQPVNNENVIEYHMTDVINNVANGIFMASKYQQGFNMGPGTTVAILPEPKVRCVICKKTFKRARDLMSHMKIMHKQMSESQRSEQEGLIELHTKSVKSNTTNTKARLKLAHQSGPRCLATSGATWPLDKSIRICFVCSKVFRTSSGQTSAATTSMLGSSVTTTTNLNKTFVRHMQIQHGLTENGDRLIECPVCEKNFFNQQQMQRHMHTHVVWVQCRTGDSGEEKDVDVLPEVVVTLKAAIEAVVASLSQGSIESAESTTAMPEHREKHSILYCHECTQCAHFYKSTKVLTKHKLIAHNLQPVYQCANNTSPHCGMEFESVDEFLVHAQLHPQKNIVCPRCHVKFNNKNLLRHHMKNVHYNRKSSTSNNQKHYSPVHTEPQLTADNKPDKPAKTSIQNCATTMDTLGTNIDVNSQVGDSVAFFSCSTCKSSFNSRNSLQNHLATHNSHDLRLFQCEQCGHAFKTRKDLSRHASLHDSAKHKTCQECGMTFKTSFHLKRHSLTRHSNIRPFKCNHCDMNFARKDKLKQHEAKHVNHPLYQCSQCKKGFYRKEHLKDHEISKHSKKYPFSCEHCAKGFVHAKDLHRHIRVRHLGSTSINNSKENLKQEPTTIKTTTTTASTAAIGTLRPSNQRGSRELKDTYNSLANNKNINSNQRAVANESLTNSDFKSKKISSILKYNLISKPAVDDIEPITPQIQTAAKINTLKPSYNMSYFANESSLMKQPMASLNSNSSSSNCSSGFTGDSANEEMNSSNQNQNGLASINGKASNMYLKSFKCQHCAKDFFYENHLRKHILSKHTVTPLFACSFCNQGFSTKSTAKSHVENSHVTYDCPVCSKSFKNRSHAQRHILSIHASSNLKDIATNLKPLKQHNNDAKLIDLSQVNMNMLNLISIENHNHNNNITAKSNQKPRQNQVLATQPVQQQIQQRPQQLQYQQQWTTQTQTPIPVIKQINSTDLNFEFIQEANLLNGNFSIDNHNNNRQTHNNSTNTNGNGNGNGMQRGPAGNANFILLNNQQLNFNNLSNFNLVTTTTTTSTGSNNLPNFSVGDTTGSQAQVFKVNKVNNENQVLQNSNFMLHGGANNKAFFNEQPTSNQPQVNCYIQQPVVFQPQQQTGDPTKNNIQFTSSSSSLPPIRYLQPHQHQQQQQQQHQLQQSEMHKNNSIRIMTPAGHLQDAKIFMTSINMQPQQQDRSTNSTMSSSHLQQQFYQPKEDFFSNSKQRNTVSSNRQNIQLPSIDISFLGANQ